jgi:hypothetical protein
VSPRFLCATVFLLVCSLGSASEPLSAQQRSDLAVLRANDQGGYKASPKVMAAARRTFSQLHFVGLPKSTVEEMLGRPREVRTSHGQQVYDYMYHDGELGIHIQFEFDPSARVTATRRLPTQ